MPKRIKQRIEINGETRWVTGTTQQEVILAAAKMLAESGAVSDTSKSKTSSPSFRECAIRWFEVYKRPKVKENTAYNYEHDMNNHVLPVFGNRRIDEIKPSDIQEFLNTKKNKAKSTVHHIWLILHGVFLERRSSMIRRVRL